VITIDVTDPSGTFEARRRALAAANRLEFSETDAGKLAIVVTEMATNLVKHASGGQIFLRPLRREEGAGIEVLCVDSGPGMSDVAACLRDGQSSAGTAGTGLGAIRRLSGLFEIYSTATKGTVLRAVCTSGTATRGSTPQFDVGFITDPKPGEDVCGDSIAVARTAAGFRAMVADGLGHGLFAAEASRAAADAFHATLDMELQTVMNRLHATLRPTRGAAIAIAELSAGEGVVRFCGVGNVAGIIARSDKSVHLVSMNGIVGHQVQTIRTFEYGWTSDSLLILHSDGLSSRWDLGSYSGLRLRSPSVIAGVLFRDARRSSDDAAVVVVAGVS
jgi:anti-sigma regulatory factor (Ser/Thr protein kinase)